MHIISNAHIDGHAALLSLLETAIPYAEQRIKQIEYASELAEKEVLEFLSQPWYKRWFSLVVPDCEHYNSMIYFARQNLSCLLKIRSRANYELTISLSDQESDLVFAGSEERC